MATLEGLLTPEESTGTGSAARLIHNTIEAPGRAVRCKGKSLIFGARQLWV